MRKIGFEPEWKVDNFFLNWFFIKSFYSFVINFWPLKEKPRIFVGRSVIYGVIGMIFQICEIEF